MIPPTTHEATRTHDTASETGGSRDPFGALLHEWFVTYNPVHLASAALVLVGLWLVSVDPATRGLLGGHGVSAIAELYALALIAGAAVLKRTGQPRAAVMLALLAALYQCDVTMHIETASFLGVLGWLGTLVWIALFPLKLWLLARALELRLSRSAFLVPSVGAAVLGLLPQLFPLVSAGARGSFVALPLFAVGAAALWTSRTVELDIGFDYRGRRAVRGVWLLWMAGALIHVAYWCAELAVSPRALLLGAVLLSTRFVVRERAVWSIVLGAVALAAMLDPGLLSITALMATAVLALRAFRSPQRAELVDPLEPPYRGATAREPRAARTLWATPPTVFAPVAPAEEARLFCGVVALLHLSLSMWGASDIWSAHHPGLDLGLTAVCAVAFFRTRNLVCVAPLAPALVHLAFQLGWLTRPRGMGGWGAWSIAVGFALLVLVVGRSWRTHRASTMGFGDVSRPAPPGG